MTFHSPEFILFLAAVVPLYFLLPFRFRNTLLLAASAFFYMWWRPEYILIILFSVTVDYFVAFGLGHDERPGKRRVLLIVSLVSNLGLLFFFKYSRFAAQTLRAALGLAHVDWQPPAVDLVLPIGISFHTFQALSYTIDVSRGRIPVERSLPRLWVYVLFFPQLVAGPIERAGRLLPQFDEAHRPDPDAIASGLRRILWGLVKKVVIADRLALLADAVFDGPRDGSGLGVLIGAYAFAFQIYADFSAYSDIAIGSARLLGFRLMENFDRPYFAASPADFWRRWHISLSTWFRDYVYIPLGGDRHGKARWAAAILITFLLSGLWHGANWTFVAWGAVHGLLLLASRLLERLPKTIRTVLTFHLVTLGWIYFRAPSLGDAHAFMARLFTGPWTAALPAAHQGSQLAFAGLGVAALLVADLRLRPPPSPALRWAALLFGALLVLNGRPGIDLPFIYFQF
jgi:D-alanyl-lipoteichoic acid acyltransferase DltB (MBOAT superfamily)